MSLDRLLEQRAEVANTPPKLPSVGLTRRGDTALTVREGEWRERIVGIESGRIAYRHTHAADGGWTIEEQHASSVPRRHLERRSTRLVLDSDFKLEACDFNVESFAGSESGTLVRSSGVYLLRFTDVDGWETKHELVTEPLMPSERLSATLWPTLIANCTLGAKTELLVLDADGGHLTPRVMTLDIAEPGSRRLTVDRPTQSTEQRYRIGGDGTFLGMEEMMPLLWLRELLPA